MPVTKLPPANELGAELGEVFPSFSDSCDWVKCLELLDLFDCEIPTPASKA
jgi:hypothetical protein